MEHPHDHPFHSTDGPGGAPALSVHLAMRDSAALIVAEGSLVRRAASGLVDLVDSLIRQPGIRRISIDASCVVDVDAAGSAAIAALRARRSQGVVVGPVGATAAGQTTTRLHDVAGRLGHLRGRTLPSAAARGC
jgi:hypothetical protein